MSGIQGRLILTPFVYHWQGGSFSQTDSFLEMLLSGTGSKENACLMILTS